MKPKRILITPVKDSTHKEGLEEKNDPVRITQSKDKTDIANKNPKQYPRRTLQRSPSTSSIQPKPISI